METTSSTDDLDAEAPTLFALDDPDLHEVTLWLTDDEHVRLFERSRQAGMSAEELLRSLI